MKQYIFKGFVAAAVLFTLPAFAQKDKSDKEKKEVQTIVITRDGNIDDKTVIEIKGNKVTVNGKDADKSSDVNVNVTTVKEGAHMSINGIGGGNTWTFSDDENGSTFFSEDENRAMLGVITELGDKGAVITSVTKGSAAEKSGLKKGDIITRIGTEKVDSDGDVATAIRSHKPGDKVAVTILREGKEQTVTAELSKWKGMNMGNFSPRLNMNDFRVSVPQPPAMPVVPGGRYTFSYNRPRLGISIQDLEEGKGVKVTDVDEDTPAAKAGLKENDVIVKVDDTNIEGTDDMRRITGRAREGSSYSFKVLRGGKEQTIEVKIPRKIKTADL